MHAIDWRISDLLGFSRLRFPPGTTAAAIARAACRASGASRAGLWRSPLLLLEETTSAAAFRIKAVQILAAQAEEYVTKRVEELGLSSAMASGTPMRRRKS